MGQGAPSRLCRPRPVSLRAATTKLTLLVSVPSIPKTSRTIFLAVASLNPIGAVLIGVCRSAGQGVSIESSGSSAVCWLTQNRFPVTLSYLGEFREFKFSFGCQVWRGFLKKRP